MLAKAIWYKTLTGWLSIKICPGALVCEESKLRGDITIGAGTIIHPSAVIIAEAGPIIIGEHCLIEEQAKIIHRFVHLLLTLVSHRVN